MEATIKTTLAKKNLEMEKLEQSKKSHLRMITSSAVRLKQKLRKIIDQKDIEGETEARKIRMYETHNPGFCYLKNGECRKKSINSNVPSNLNFVQCSEKVREILFTDNELDIYKTICLHLLGTHIQNKNHIQKKDGRLCSYVKAQMAGNIPNTLELISPRVNTNENELSIYDKMLPRYILDVNILHPVLSSCSLKTTDFESGSDDETKRNRKCLVPVYINNEIKIIISSVLEALKTVESSKLKDLVELASSPEELRNLLSKDEMQEIMLDLSRNPLVLKPTSYDFVMTHLMFDKIPEQGTLETVAQVLEVYVDSELKKSLNQIRRNILLKHLELTNSNLINRKKIGMQDKPSGDNWTLSNSSINYSMKFKSFQDSRLMRQNKIDVSGVKLNKAFSKNSMDVNSVLDIENDTNSYKKMKDLFKSDSKDSCEYSEKMVTDGNAAHLGESFDDENYRHRSSYDSNRCNIHNLSNSQRILLGLKVASLKSRPINMHQFEGKKKVDLAAIINPIIRPQVSDINYKQNSPENRSRNFALPEKKIKKPVAKVSTISTSDLENLSRELLAYLRLEISEIENKKKVNQFVAKI